MSMLTYAWIEGLCILQWIIASFPMGLFINDAYLIAELEKAIATVLRTERQYLHHACQSIMPGSIPVAG